MARLTTRRIASRSVILLDTSAFVYFLERHERYGAVAEELFQRIEHGDLSAVASHLVLTELLVPAYRAQEPDRAQAIVTLLTTFPHVTWKPVTAEVACRAAQLRAEHNLRTPDAIHMATGLIARVSWVVTNDKGFSRISSLDVRVWMFEKEVT